jgi:hypothetical protein
LLEHISSTIVWRGTGVVSEVRCDAGVSKRDPLSAAVFVHGSQGVVELHSPAQDFTLDTLRRRQETPATPE